MSNEQTTENSLSAQAANLSGNGWTSAPQQADANATKNPNEDLSRATEQPITEADKKAQAEAGAAAARKPDDGKEGTGPMLGRDWATTQDASATETGVVRPAADEDPTKLPFYRGPVAGNHGVKFELGDLIKHTLLKRFFDKEGRTKQETKKPAMTDEAFNKVLLSQQVAATESANANNPTADSDGPNKVAPGQTIADVPGWQAGR